MGVADAVRNREIKEVLHFTTNHGVLGMFAIGAILPRKNLPEEKYLEHVYKFNAKHRKDIAYLGHVSASISRVNTEFFSVSRNWHAEEETWWAIVSMDPEILSHEEVVFATTNNIYPSCLRATGEAGFQAMFADPVFGRYGYEHNRSDGMPDFWTTDVQAEVLYPGPIPTRYARSVYVVSHDHADLAASQYEILRTRGDSSDQRTELPISVRPELFT